MLILSEGWAKAVALSLDERLLAVATVDGVCLFDMEELVAHAGWVTTEEVPPLAKFPLEGYVHTVDFSPDGRYVAAGGWSLAKVWNLNNYEPFAELKFRGFVYAVSFGPDGKVLLGTSTGKVALWIPGEEEPLWARRLHGGSVWSVAASPDGKRAASGGAEKGLLFLLSDATVLFAFPGHAWDLAFTPDGFLLGVGAGKVFEIYDTATGFPYFSAQRHHGCIWGVSFSSDGNLAATASLDGTVRLWDVEEGKDLLVLGEGKESMEDVDVGGGYLVACRKDGRVYIWKLSELLVGDEG